MVTWIKRYGFLITVTIAVSLFYGGDHLLQIRKLGWQQYEPLTVASDLDAAVTYYPRAKAVFEGDWIVGDINVAEYAESPVWMSILNPIVMGNFFKLFGSIKLGVIVSDFMFPAGIFLLLYWFTNLLVQKKLLSIIPAVFFIFGPGLPFWKFGKLATLPIFSFDFTRIDWPKATMIFYLLAAIGAWNALRKQRVIYTVFAGLFAGALFYTDLYDWVTFYTGLGLLLMWFMFTHARAHAKIIGLVMAMGLAVSIGYWMNFFELTTLPQYQDIVTRVGVERSHGFRFFTWWLYLRIALVIGALYWVFRHRKQSLSPSPLPARASQWQAGLPSPTGGEGVSKEFFLVAFLLPIFVTLNLQVITGLNPQPDHWVRPLLPFMYGALALIALCIYERYLARISKRIWVAGGILLIIFIFSAEVLYIFKVGDRGQMHDLFKGSQVARAQYAIPTQGASSYQWLKENIVNQAVVGSISPATNLDLQLYTGNKLFLPFGLNTIASNEEIWQRFFYLARLYSIPAARLKEILVDDKEMGLYLFQNAFYADELNSYFKGSPQAVPKNVFDEKIGQYQEVVTVDPPFRLDYIYYGPNEKALRAQDPIQQIPDLEKVYEDEEVTVYEF